VCTIEGISLLVAPNLEADLLLPRLDPLPQAVFDNTQMRNLDDLPLGAGIGSGNPLAGARILDVAAPVPFEAPSVKRVADTISLTSAPLAT
jgi:hypothetical protein